MDATARVPMRWPCGPLEIERAKAVPGVSASDVLALRQWSEPALLDRLTGSPVSCLVVPWAEGSERDAEHQRSLVPLVASARQRGLALVGWSGEKADARRALQAARDAGLDAIATGAPDAPADAAVLRFATSGSPTGRLRTSWGRSGRPGRAFASKRRETWTPRPAPPDRRG